MGSLGLCTMQLYRKHNADGEFPRVVLWTNQLTGVVMPGVDVRPIDIDGLIAGTPFAAHPDRFGTVTLKQNGAYAGRPKCGSQLFDALKLAVLYKHGGGSFDLDILSLAPAKRTPMAAATWMDAKMLNNAPLFFPAGDECLLAVMEAMVDKVKDPCPVRWADNGPPVLDKVLRNRSEARCNHVRILPLKTYHPLMFHKFHSKSMRKKVMESLDDKELEALVARGTVALHLFSSVHQASDIKRLVEQLCGELSPVEYVMHPSLELVTRSSKSKVGGYFVRGAWTNRTRELIKGDGAADIYGIRASAFSRIDGWHPRALLAGKPNDMASWTEYFPPATARRA